LIDYSAQQHLAQGKKAGKHNTGWSSPIRHDILLGLLFLWLPGLVPRPVPLPRVKGMPLGVVDQLLALTGVVLLVLHKVPSSLPGQQLIASAICDVMQPSMPFRRHLGCIVTIFLCIFHPPMPSMLSVLQFLIVLVSKLVKPYKCCANIVNFCLPGNRRGISCSKTHSHIHSCKVEEERQVATYKRFPSRMQFL